MSSSEHHRDHRDRVVLYALQALPSGEIRAAEAHLVLCAECRREPIPAPEHRAAEPEWEEAGAGISCKVLAIDVEQDRVSMLVRLAPGAAYPPHRHAGVEELHLLDGELMIDEKKLDPGDYFRAEAGTVDRRVWSETGCTCVLMTSLSDALL